MVFWPRINHYLVTGARELGGEGVADSRRDRSQAKTTESGGIRGFDAGKEIKGHKRHIVVDSLGLAVGLMVHSADIQDRDGAPDLQFIRNRWPWLLDVFADGVCAGDKLKKGYRKTIWTLEIIKRHDGAKGLTCCRAAGSSSVPSPGLVDAGGWPRKIRHFSRAWITPTIRVLARRLARYGHR